MPVSPNAIPSSGPISISALNAEFGKGYNLAAYEGILRYRVSDNYREYTPSGANAYVSMGDFHGYQASSPVVSGSRTSTTGSIQLPAMFNQLYVTVYGGSGGGGGGAFYLPGYGSGAGGDGSGGGATSFYGFSAAGGGGGTGAYPLTQGTNGTSGAIINTDSSGIRAGGGAGNGNGGAGGGSGGNGGKNYGLKWDINTIGWAAISAYYNVNASSPNYVQGGPGGGGSAGSYGVGSASKGGDGTAGYISISWT